MQSDPPMLDEIILALQSGASGDVAVVVPELTLEELITDAGGEAVDLVTILGHGDAQEGKDLSVMMMELGSSGQGDTVSVWSSGAAAPDASLGEGSALHAVLSLYGDDPPAN